MKKSFLDDTGLTQKQFDLVNTLYNKVKDNPLHLELVQQGNSLIEDQENEKLFALIEKGIEKFGFVYPLVFLNTLYPSIVSLFSRLGLDETIRSETLSEIGLWVGVYEKENDGETGLERNHWIARVVTAKVVRLGRLEYEDISFKFPYSIYYDKKAEKYRTFALEGVVCTRDGYLTEKGELESGTWITTLSEKDNHLLAHEVNQEVGYISKDVSSVSLSDIKLICTQGTPCYSVHIPAGEALTPSLAEDSLSLAFKLFKPNLVVCNSWLLDPELRKVLDPESNIIHFMNRFLKFPTSFSTPQIYERVFKLEATEADVIGWECKTSLQNKVQQHVKNGGRFRTMGGFIPSNIEL